MQFNNYDSRLWNILIIRGERGAVRCGFSIKPLPLPHSAVIGNVLPRFAVISAVR